MNIDPMLKVLFNVAMTSNRKRTESVAEMYDKFDYVPVPKRINISKEKKEYLNLAMKFEQAVKTILAGENDSMVALHYNFDLEILRKEIGRFQISKMEVYEYNDDTGRIFSVKEELMLLEILAMIPRVRCTCQTYILQQLPILAYYMALRKRKLYPREWNKHQQAGKEWQTNFAIEYDYEISTSFPIKCKVHRKNQNM